MSAASERRRRRRQEEPERDPDRLESRGEGKSGDWGVDQPESEKQPAAGWDAKRRRRRAA